MLRNTPPSEVQLGNRREKSIPPHRRQWRRVTVLRDPNLPRTGLCCPVFTISQNEPQGGDQRNQLESQPVHRSEKTRDLLKPDRRGASEEPAALHAPLSAGTRSRAASAEPGNRRCARSDRQTPAAAPRAFGAAAQQPEPSAKGRMLTRAHLEWSRICGKTSRDSASEPRERSNSSCDHVAKKIKPAREQGKAENPPSFELREYQSLCSGIVNHVEIGISRLLRTAPGTVVGRTLTAALPGRGV